jgi:hypothetical protein
MCLNSCKQVGHGQKELVRLKCVNILVAYVKTTFDDFILLKLKNYIFLFVSLQFLGASHKFLLCHNKYNFMGQDLVKYKSI